MYDFSVNYNTIDISDIIGIYDMFDKKAWYSIMFGFNIWVYCLCLCNIIIILDQWRDSIGPIKCVFLNNETREAKPILLNINSN